MVEPIRAWMHAFTRSHGIYRSLIEAGRHDANLSVSVLPTDAYEEMVARIARLEAERDEARLFAEAAAARYNDLIASGQVLRCAFCGEQYPPGTPGSQHERLSRHIATCSKHPMRTVEAELETLRRAALGWMQSTPTIVILERKDDPRG